MRIDKLGPNYVEVTLSKRNCQSLLAKLEGHPTNSERTIIKEEVMLNMDSSEERVTFIVHVQDDLDHYGEREPGPMEEETEAAIKEME